MNCVRAGKRALYCEYNHPKLHEVEFKMQVNSYLAKQNHI